jgi:hypothetical protein
MSLATWLWFHFHPNPKEVIRKQLNSLTRVATVRPEDSQLVRLADAQKLPEFFSPNARIILNSPDFPQGTIEGREEISDTAAALKSHIDSLKIEFVDIDIIVASDKQTAQANLTAKITFPGDEGFSAQELKFLLRLINGKWIVTQAETVKAFN